MAQTQPKFQIIFQQLAVTAIQRSAQGIVALILDDSVMTADKLVYNDFGEVKSSDLDAKNYELLQLCFMGNPKKVIVVKKQSDIADTLVILKKIKFNYYAMPDAAASDITALKSAFASMRANLTGFMKGVFANALTPDDPAIINFASVDDLKLNFTGTVKDYTPGEFTVRIAGILAGMPDSQSATYYRLSEIVDCTLSDDPDADAGAGKLIVLFDGGKFKLGRAINSLTTLTDGITEAFQKIRIVSTMDLIKEDIVTTYKDSYVGKFTNTYQKKLMFCGAATSYLHSLQPVLLDKNMANEIHVSYEQNKAYLESRGIPTEDLTYEQILQYNTGDDVLLDGNASPTDTMEDLKIFINMYKEVA